MTETDLDQLPDREGYERALSWCKDSFAYNRENDIDTDNAVFCRLLIVGTSGTGKTRALTDAAAENKEMIEVMQRRYGLWQPYYMPTCFIMNNVQFQRWNKAGTNCEDDSLTAFISGECVNCQGEGCNAFKFIPHVADEAEIIFIDDLQEFTSKAALQYLKHVLENYDVMLALQIPEGVGDFKKWLLNRFSGQYGNNQVEAEAVIRRMGEEGFSVIRMRRDDDTKKNAEG